MSEQLYGADALNALNDDGGSENEFSSFKSGTTYLVKVLGTADVMRFFSYGIYKKVNSFVAKNPSKKSKKGYPVEDYTPWDKAWKYYKDLADESGEEYTGPNNVEAGKYRVNQRFAFGFFDLDDNKPIVIDVSRNQAQVIMAAIKKYEKKLGKVAFELSKEGSSTSTTVSLTPVLDMEDDLTDKQRKHFDEAPTEFDRKKFEGILYEADEAEQIELLKQAGFDVSLIGLTAEGSENNESIADLPDEAEAAPSDDF